MTHRLAYGGHRWGHHGRHGYLARSGRDGGIDRRIGGPTGGYHGGNGTGSHVRRLADVRRGITSRFLADSGWSLAVEARQLRVSSIRHQQSLPIE